MKITEKRYERWTGSGKRSGFLYEDSESGRVYGRVVAGFAYPYVEREGFIVAVAEALEKDHSLPFSPKHKWIVEEFESANLEELYRCCLRLKDESYVKDFLGDSEDPLHHLLIGYGKDSSSHVYLTRPGNFDDLTPNYVFQLLRKYTQTMKVLHFGEGGKLPGYLTGLRAEDVAGKELQSWPPLCALGYALSYLETGQDGDTSGFYTRLNAERRRRVSSSRYSGNAYDKRGRF